MIVLLFKVLNYFLFEFVEVVEVKLDIFYFKLAMSAALKNIQFASKKIMFDHDCISVLYWTFLLLLVSVDVQHVLDLTL